MENNPQNQNKEKIITSFNHSKKIADFLKYGTNTIGTSRYYKTRLKEFFIEQNITNINNFIKNPREMSRKDEIKYIEKWEEHIRKHHHYLTKIRQPPLAGAYVFLSAINELLKYYNIIINDQIIKKLRRKSNGNNRIGKRKTPTKEQLQKILSNTDIEGKALIFTQMTSGSRIGEIITIRLNDIDIDHEYPRIFIRPSNSKNNNQIRKRISPETKKSIINYLEQRDKIIEIRIKRTPKHLRKPLDKNLLFPMSKQNAEEIWNRAVKKSGLYELDSITNKPLMGSHSLRRYFKIHFSNYDQNLAKYFMGQTTKIDEAYDDWTDEMLDDHYSKGVKYLFIEQSTIETDYRIKRQEHEITKLKDELETSHDKIHFLETRLKSDKNRLEKIENILSRKVYDDIDPLKEDSLTEEEHDYEEKIENKAILEKERKLKNLIDTDPKYKDSKIIYLDRTYDFDGYIQSYGVPYLTYKQKKPTTPEDLEILFSKANAHNYLLNLDKKERDKLIKEIEKTDKEIAETPKTKIGERKLYEELIKKSKEKNNKKK